ncbi:MAG: hypothetical protein EG826_04430 [Deltaproteobacteria bacterium]|nr:hypothetical protein [Deltaproteobacteria bacterium]
MSLQNEMRRTRMTNLQYTEKRLRADIDSLVKLICINLDGSLHRAEDLPIAEIDSQWDDLKSKWADLISAQAKIKRLEEELK